MAKGDLIGQIADEVSLLLKAGTSYEKAFSIAVHKRRIYHSQERHLYNNYFRSVLERLKKRPSIRALDLPLPGKSWKRRRSAPLRKQGLTLVPELPGPKEDSSDSPEDWPPIGQYREEDFFWEDKYLVGEADE